MHKLAVMFALGATLAPSLAAQGLQTTLEAIQPLTLSLGGVPQQQHPAGPLTSASLSILDPTCLANGTLTCAITGNSLSASHNVWGPNCGGLTATSDLRLNVSALQPGWATLRMSITASGDCGGQFRVDVGDDGSNEVSYSWGSTFEKTRNLVIPVGTTPLPVRIYQYTCGAQPTGQSVNLVVEQWDATATQDQVGCGGLFGSAGWQAIECDHTLMFVDDPAPGALGVLRAGGFGQFHSFVVASTAPTAPLQLPAPFTQICPTLANVLLLAPGAQSGMLGRQILWELPVPTLPVGLTFFVQHACAAVWQLPQMWALTRFDTSNVVRIDT